MKINSFIFVIVNTITNISCVQKITLIAMVHENQPLDNLL